MSRALGKFKERISRALRRPQDDGVAESIAELRADIDEVRRDNLRIAQLHDVVVERLAQLDDKANPIRPHQENHSD